eukprot:2651555-Karenia_brevis.AAC.1
MAFSNGSSLRRRNCSNVFDDSSGRCLSYGCSTCLSRQHDPHTVIGCGQHGHSTVDFLVSQIGQ